MFKTIANAWKTVDLRKKILFTVLIVLLYRVGTAIPVPFLNAQVLSSSLLLRSFNVRADVGYKSGCFLGIDPRLLVG